MKVETEAVEPAVDAPALRPAHAVMTTHVSVALLETLSNLPDGILLVDLDWRISYANEMAQRIGHIQPQDLNGPDFWTIYPGTPGTELERRYRRVMQDRVSEDFDFFYAPFQSWFKNRVFPSGSGIAVVFQDITELRHLQAARDEANARELQVMSAITDAVITIDRNWIITFLNDAARKLLAASGEVLGRSFFQAFPDTVYDGSPYVEHYFRAMSQFIPGSFEASYPEPLNIRIQIQVRPSKDGIVLFVRDVTQLRKDEQALRNSEERYRALTDLGVQCVWAGAPDGSITYANRRFVQYIGERYRANLGEEWISAFFEPDRVAVLANWIRSVQTGEEYNLEARLIRAEDGAVRWFHLRAQALRNGDGSIHMWLGVAEDIHDRRIAVDSLLALQHQTERQRAELETLYDSAPVGLSLCDPEDFRYLRVSKRLAEIIGLPQQEIVGRKVEEIVTSEGISTLLARVRHGESLRDQQHSLEFKNSPGVVRSFNSNYAPVMNADGTVRAISGAVLEVTHLRKAEEALVRSEKLAAVGRLASSISHEINNPLEAVTNLLYLIAGEQGLGQDATGYVQMAQEELRRVSQIATQTLRFHRQANSPTQVTAYQLIEPVLRLFHGRLMNSGITVDSVYKTDRNILCFENDIRQILNNLIANAIDAMRTGGRLCIRAHNAYDLRSGFEGVRITVADNGHGMDGQTRQRIFEPFYTTKALNGNGLGLWISQGIVERHQGQLRVRSSQHASRRGTAFSLFLPSNQEPVAML